ncbi:ABC transporter permease subunit [Micromonospora sp. KC721]|uniref:ABC transporter permease subunit n=1 Tax=Micromonospora sp. KC721 TaxID=2530380 RepID=UPI00104A7BC7|nr:ABC transporter permease subunit [Micromonospora sp. KC721]TDB69531.1 transporter [Micromonospora sp. KC721]
MTWLTWRQHRAEAAVLALLVAVAAAVLLLLGTSMHGLFPHGVARCAGGSVTEGCSVALQRLWEEHGYASKMLSLFNLLPFVIGAFLGAPLLARELETGTWQLAWTQSVPRMRWLAVKLAALGSLAVVLTLALSAVITWYRHPLDVLDGRFNADAFDLEGVVPAAYALFAFAFAAAAGVLLRRSLPALAAALAAFLAVRVAVAGALRPYYAPPETLANPVTAGDTTVDVGGPRPSTGNHLDWILTTGYSDAAGRRLGLTEVYRMGEDARRSGLDLATHLHDRGVSQWVEFHPAERFWTFQLIEAALFLSLTAVLLTVVVWRVRRRAL